MSYSKIVEVKEGFKTSINIEFDLLKNDKLLSYIPTDDVCEILSYYYDSFNDSKINRSTVLEGPYGKGKSHLLLSLLQLVSSKNVDKNTKEFLSKINQIGTSLYKKITDAKAREFSLLPVIINSNYSKLSQSLNIALKDALTRVGIEDLFPETAYEVALNVIKKWKKEVDAETINKCLIKEKTTLADLENGLSNYSFDHYETFVRIYNCISRGLDFNPFASDDVVKNYADVSYKISEYGYSGMFVVFDEFSKFIEDDRESLANELKLLQDLSEKASRSGEKGQLHLCCITHKSLNEYCRDKKETTVNAFKTIEGRFQELRFNRSLNQNYTIIALSINKKKDFDSAYDTFSKDNRSFIDSLKNYRMFSEANEDIYLKGCYPINPLTVFSAIQISEKIAQNERTLFTFLSDSDKNSFSSFVKKGKGLFNVNNIYDYFEELINRSDDDNIKNIGRRTEICLEKVEEETEKNIIKVIAVIRIINNSMLNADLQTIADCLNLKTEDVEKNINILIEKGLIRKLFSNGSYDFTSANSKEIEDKISEHLIKSKNYGISNILNDLYKNEFVLPRRYNTEYKITRFFRIKYICDSEFENLSAYDAYFNEFSDGIILRVLLDKKNPQDIVEIFKKTKNNKRIILQTCKLPQTTIDEIIRIGSMKIVKQNKDLDQNVTEEINKIINDESYDLYHALKKEFNSCGSISVYGENSLLESASLIMEKEYYATPVINNEMINRNISITSQYLKPRNNIVNLYISNEIDKVAAFSPTGPEKTVFNSFEDNDPKKRVILELIKEELQKTEKKKTVSSNILNLLFSSPYGIRKGVIPLFIAKAFNELNCNIVFYYESKEVDFNAENIEKMVENPDKYYFELEKKTNEKTQYIKDMLKLFETETTNNFRNDNKIIIKKMQNWILSLPRVIRSCDGNDNYLNLDDEFIKMKKIFSSFDLNEHDVLFNQMIEIFGSYKNTLTKLSKYKKNSSLMLEKFETEISNNIKLLYKENKKTSLYNAVHDWINNEKANDRILEDKERKFIAIFSEENYNDNYLLNEISKVLFKVKITDWDRNRSEEISDFIDSMISNIRNRQLSTELKTNIKSKKDIQLTSIGKLLKNNIEDTMDEYNESVSNKEKIEILTQLLKELM